MRSLNVQDLKVLEETVQENKHMLKKFCEGQPQSVLLTELCCELTPSCCTLH